MAAHSVSPRAAGVSLAAAAPRPQSLAVIVSDGHGPRDRDGTHKTCTQAINNWPENIRVTVARRPGTGMCTTSMICAAATDSGVTDGMVPGYGTPGDVTAAWPVARPGGSGPSESVRPTVTESVAHCLGQC